jgi:hypothetical protein
MAMLRVNFTALHGRAHDVKEPRVAQTDTRSLFWPMVG